MDGNVIKLIKLQIFTTNILNFVTYKSITILGQKLAPLHKCINFRKAYDILMNNISILYYLLAHTAGTWKLTPIPFQGYVITNL